MNNLNFDFTTLGRFISENIDFLNGARIQKIQQPTRQELIFVIRNIGESRKFYININPKFFHACFMSPENEKKRFLEIPKQPPMFCMLLRKYIESSKIAKVEQPEGERILEFYFETHNELGEIIYLCLAIELMGKHSNVVLYNYDTNMIIGCMHNVGAEKSSVREIIGGLPYCYPPKKQNKIISGFSDLLSPDILVNTSIDDYFSNLQLLEKIKGLKSKHFISTKTKLRKTIATLEKIAKQSGTQEKADLCRKKGDLIMANLYNNRDFSSFIEVIDYETNSLLKIKLDETKTLKENANQFYKLYNKAKTAHEKTQEMVGHLQGEKEYLEQIIYSIDSAECIEDLFEIEEELEKSEKKKVKSERKVSEPLMFNLSGFSVYVGKNNKQNDYIVSKFARAEDMWFHVHNCAGSHVLLRVEAGQELTDEIIFECAKLAKEYSSGKLSSKVGVIYTRAKNLKKPTAANLGYVIYKGEKEIIID